MNIEEIWLVKGHAGLIANMITQRLWRVLSCGNKVYSGDGAWFTASDVVVDRLESANRIELEGSVGETAAPKLQYGNTSLVLTYARANPDYRDRGRKGIVEDQPHMPIRTVECTLACVR